MTFVNHTHFSLGYLLFVLVLLELVWTLVETITSTNQSSFSSLKSSIVVGLLDLQTLLGVINAYFLSTIPMYHILAMLGAVGTFHVGNKQSDWTRTLFQALGTILVVIGIGVRHMMG